jgi:hypothetical protein
MVFANEHDNCVECGADDVTTGCDGRCLTCSSKEMEARLKEECERVDPIVWNKAIEAALEVIRLRKRGWVEAMNDKTTNYSPPGRQEMRALDEECKVLLHDVSKLKKP